MKIILFTLILVIPLGGLLTQRDECNEDFCFKKDEYLSKTRYLLYDVNNVEGFNLRRDVYIRVATMVNNLRYFF